MVHPIFFCTGTSHHHPAQRSRFRGSFESSWSCIMYAYMPWYKKRLCWMDFSFFYPRLVLRIFVWKTVVNHTSMIIQFLSKRRFHMYYQSRRYSIYGQFSTHEWHFFRFFKGRKKAVNCTISLSVYSDAMKNSWNHKESK